MSRRARGRSAGLTLVIVCASLAPFLVVLPERASAYTVHEAIVIDGNAGFVASNGVVGGTGTAGDPFIIEGWEIFNATRDGIVVTNTDAYVVIRDAFIHPGNAFNASIVLEGVRHVRIVNVTVSDAYEGISLGDCSDVTIENSTATSNAGNGLGIGDCDAVTVRGNTVSDNRFAGILVGSASNVTVQSNGIFRGSIGIAVDWSSNVTVVANQIVDQRHAMDLSGPTPGILVFHNSFVNSTESYVYDLSTGVDMGAWDAGYPGGGNYWSNCSGVDRCTGANQDVCSGPDGIGDTPMLVGRLSWDYYPLMAPWSSGTEAPVAAFSVSPAWAYVGAMFTTTALNPRDVAALPSLVRWDWDGDGTWDTNWSSSLTASHRYVQAANYTVIMEASFGGSVSAFARKVVVVAEMPTAVDGRFAEFVVPVLVALVVVVALVSSYLVRRGRRRKPDPAEAGESEANEPHPPPP